MKAIVLITGILIGLSGILPAQGFSQNNLSKEDRKRIKKEKQRIDFEETKYVLENKSFILEAHTLYDRYGNSIQVSPEINFIGIDSTDAIIQTGNTRNIGMNGLGGLTAKGGITSYELNANEKKKNFNLNFYVNSPVGAYEVMLLVDASGYARATLYSNWGKSISYSGKIYPKDESIFYKGHERYY